MGLVHLAHGSVLMFTMKCKLVGTVMLVTSPENSAVYLECYKILVFKVCFFFLLACSLWRVQESSVSDLVISTLLLIYVHKRNL